MFATNLPINSVDDADEIFCWGRRRWNIENVFKEQKHSGFGLKHRFVNAKNEDGAKSENGDDPKKKEEKPEEKNVNKVWYHMMQIAWTLWQMFQRGFLLRLEAGCRKMTQVLWAEELRTFIRHFGIVGLEPRYRLFSRRHL